MDLDAKAQRQARWRERKSAGQESGLTSITVHLTDDEIRILDAIAIQIYNANRHAPPKCISDITPGRPAAVRELISQARKRVRKKRTNRREMGDFWRREASWRRSTNPQETGAEPSTPPWKRK